MSRNRGVHEISVSWLSFDKGQVWELTGRHIGGLLLLEASHILYFLFSWGQKLLIYGPQV